MMPNHWGYVIGAYALALLVFGGYWRRLIRRQRELETRPSRRRGAR